MNLPGQIAKHFREVHVGGNWTSVNLKDTLAGINWQQATKKVYSLNTIVALVYHMNYYVMAISKVLKKETLDSSDKFSFDHPLVQSQEDWEKLMDKTWADAEALASLIEKLPEDILEETFVHTKYGTYYRNLQGNIEHLHYHLGQIVLIKKIVMQAEGNTK